MKTTPTLDSPDVACDLVHWKSKVNGGRTTIIPSTADAVALGRAYIDRILAGIADAKAKGVTKVEVKTKYRDSNKVKTKTESIGTHEGHWQRSSEQYTLAVDEITKGNAHKHEISELSLKLMQLALDLQPSINSNYCGFERWEEGDEVLPDLLADGDDRPFLRRKRGEVEPRQSKGNGAYRIIINTDISWWGEPHMNAAVMGALVMVLQQFAPVEIWIQQGWLGSDPDDGVSLFKLDFSGSFDATQLAFWCGSEYKDSPFSAYVNRGVGRQSTATSTKPEIECDLYMRGDWMTLSGISTTGLKAMSKPEQEQHMAKWIAATCSEILYGEDAHLQC